MATQSTVSLKEILGFIVVLVVGLALTPTIMATCNATIQGDLNYYSIATTNADFADNDSDNCPAYWDNVVTDNWMANWSQSDERVWDNGDNGTASWYQSLTVSSLHDGVNSATIVAKFRLYDNENLATFTARVYLDNGTDNNVIWESTSIENSASYTSIENDVSSYITATGTYYIRLWENAVVTDNANIIVYWDDASLGITTHGYEPMTGISATMIQLMPLFYVIGLLAVVVAWTTKKIGSKQ